MKNTRLMVIVMLVAVCAMSWMLYLKGAAAEGSERNAVVQEARDNRDKKLYQLAVDAYNEALSLDESETLYNELLDTCEAYYAEDPSSSVRKKLVTACEAATKAYPKRADYWERYAQLYLDNEDYVKAGAVLEKAKAAKAESEKLDEQWQLAYYAYKVNYRGFSSISMAASNGMYVASDDDGWGTVDTLGEDVLSFIYTYVGPVGEGGLVLAVTESGEAQLLGEDGVMHGRFQANVVQAGGYSDGLIPVLLEGRTDWCYVDANGKEVLSGYLMAGTFQDGQAAVQTRDGHWCLIDTEGKQCSGETWDEILLGVDGGYLHDGRAMMRSGEKWYLYDKYGDAVEDFSCDAIDIRIDSLIAFCENGKWGFVSRSGKVYIEPAYDDARSFSNGIGAVCKEGLWGFVDEDGNLVVDYTFAEVGYFNEDGTCVVKMPDSLEYSLIEWYVAR